MQNRTRVAPSGRIFGPLALAMTLAMGCEDNRESAQETEEMEGLDGGLDAGGDAGPGCTGDPGDEGCPCDEEGLCEEGLVCDWEEEICRPALTCEDLDCEALCQPSPVGGDALCVEVCEPGYFTDGESDVCARDDASCILGAEKSIALECEQLSRLCAEDEQGAVCGECFYGYTQEGSSCRPVKTCDELQCQLENRACRAALPHRDAACEACLPGYEEQSSNCATDPTATCGPTSDVGSIADECESRNRTCLKPTATEGARCGECVEGFAKDPDSGECTPLQGCEALACEEQNRACVPLPNAHCTGCLDGHLVDRATGDCIAIRTCADLTCPEGTVCEPEFDNRHAFCWDDHGCASDQLWDAKRQVCVQCPVCGDEEGESDRRWPKLTLGTDRCICATLEGYFFSDATDLQIYPCDADGDGWVRKDAQAALAREESSPIRMNARCELRTIDRIVLENEAGETEEVLLEPAGVMGYLYEPTLLDDDMHILKHPVEFPPYGARGRTLFARELNPLTKACVDPVADFNNNGVADVNEWQQESGEYQDLTEPKDFIPYAYFIELLRGWFEPGKYVGAYHIQEKSRYEDAFPGDHVPITYPEGAGKQYWQECERMRDASFDPDPEVPDLGLDFARYESAEMNHHSQFKCVLIADQEPAVPEEKPTTLTKEQLGTAYLINDCTTEAVSAVPVTGETEPNPWDPEITCELVKKSAVEVGTVAWAAIGYQDYRDRSTANPNTPEAYARGCVNECTEHPEYCPGFNPNDSSGFQMTCDGSEVNFGKIGCGCGEAFAFGDYDHSEEDGRCGSLGCPGHAIKNSFRVDNRQGFWTCSEMPAGAMELTEENEGYAVEGSAAGADSKEMKGGDYVIKDFKVGVI